MNRTIGTHLPCIVLDVDSKLADLLQSHLTKYKLRSKLDIIKTNLKVIQAWGPLTERLWLPPTTSNLPLGSFVAKQGLMDGFIGCKDPRHPHLGIRFVVEETKVDNRKYF